MTDLLLSNATLIDPSSGAERPGAVLVRDGTIADIAAGAAPGAPTGARRIDCAGRVLSPGLIDLRAFVGEPGAEHRETLASASAAAAAGGVTTLVCMPDTNPIMDGPAIVDFVLRRARDTASVNVLPAAAITKGLGGREMTEFGLLQEAGAVAFTDGLRAVADAQVMRRALTYARDFGALIMQHVEEPSLAAEGVMNEGELASRLGLMGVPREAETVMLERDIRLARLTGARYHASMISCADSVEIVRRAKEDGLPVTCGVSVLASGVIDVIVSDHNPQDADTKRLPFAEAADGALGIETLLGAALRLVHTGDITLPRLLAALTANPAALLGKPAGRLAVGAPADLVLIDPDLPYILDKRRLKSRSKNSPFDEARLQGAAVLTMVGGRIVHAIDDLADAA